MRAKKVFRSLVLAAALSALAVPSVFAGAPQAHGLAGRDFGAAVSSVATTYGGQAIAAHVSGR